MERKKRRAKSVLRLKVNGSAITPGRIPIPQLVAICEQAQTAIHRQAEARKGRKSLKPGRVSADVAETCTLELFAIGSGSAVLSFAPPESPPMPPDLLELAGIEADTLSAVAVLEVVESIDMIRDGAINDVEIGVLKSFQEMSEVFGEGISAIEWIVPRKPGHKRTVAVFDRTVSDRIKAVDLEATEKPVVLDGILEMADFKASDLKCIIHTSADQRVPCSFTEDLADDVYKALRHATRITGTGSINPKTKRPDSIEIESVQILDPNLIDADSFFAGQTLSELATAQGVRAGAKIEPLDDGESDEETDAFLAAIYLLRS